MFVETFKYLFQQQLQGEKTATPPQPPKPLHEQVCHSCCSHSGCAPWKAVEPCTNSGNNSAESLNPRPQPRQQATCSVTEPGERRKAPQSSHDTYWALETSVLSVDAASGEPHIGFLEGKWNISSCALLADSGHLGLEPL